MNAATPKKREWPVIRVFVSSTFTDFKHERNALHQNVFRKLELHCAARGFQFQAIDLRWGVPMEAALNHRTMQICFEELRRSQQISPQPNFLILLGNRYGWRPLPEVISAKEFARGFEVWFDRMPMPSRGLTFQREIQDAVAARERLVLVVGPKAALSDCVRQEWQFALQDDKAVTPSCGDPSPTIREKARQSQTEPRCADTLPRPTTSVE